MTQKDADCTYKCFVNLNLQKIQTQYRRILPKFFKTILHTNEYKCRLKLLPNFWVAFI